MTVSHCKGQISSVIFAILLASPTLAARGSSLLSNVPEAANYTLVYQLEIPVSPNWSNNPVAYSADNSATIFQGSFNRIAYYLELVTTGGATQWVYVSMNPFTGNAGKLGVPTVASGEFYNYAITGPITNANIFSSEAGITNGTGINTVNLEFWPSSYGTNNDYGVPGATNTAFDFGDGGAGTGLGYGSMQIHNYGAGQTIFAYNNWNGGGTDLGIGNKSTGEPDWTFAGNVNDYSVRTLQILVSPTTTNGDGSWNVDAGGNWSTSNKWLNSVVAFGQGKTAYFTNAITADRTVTNDYQVAGIGNLRFGAPGAFNWTIKNNEIYLTNATIPSIVVNNNSATLSAVLNGKHGFMKSGAGTLILSNANSYAGPTIISNGTLRLISPPNGLYEGRLAGSWDTTTPNPATSVVSTVRMGNTNGKPPWGDSETWVYTGFINNPDPTNVTWTFAENIDDDASIRIDGNLLWLNDGGWANPTRTNYTLTPGYHSIEIRMGNGAGGAGYSNQGWLNNNMGICYDPQGRAADNPAFYQFMTDPGDGSLFSLANGTVLPRNTALSVASGAVVDFNGSAHVLGSLSDYGGGGGLVTNSAGQIIKLVVGSDDTSTTFSGVISVSNSLTKVGSGTLTLSGQNTYIGATVVNQGVLNVIQSDSIRYSSNLTVNAGAMARINETTDQILVCTLAGTNGTIMKTGAAKLTIASSNSYAGSIVVSNGTLDVSVSGSTAATNISIEAGARLVIENSSVNVIAVNAAFNLKTGAPNGKIYMTNGVVEVAGSLYFDGTVQPLGTYGATGSGAANIDDAHFEGPGMLLVGNWTGSWALDAGGNWNTPGNWTNNVIPMGIGTAYFTNAIGTDRVVNQNYLKLGIANLTFGSPGSYNWTVAGSPLILVSPSVIAVNANTATVASAIEGTMGLTKQGSGTLALSGANVFSGSTIINSGTVTLGANNTLPTTPGTTLLNGILDLNGFSNVVRNLSGITGKATCSASANSTLVISNDASTLYTGQIENGAGTVSVIKSGTGTLTLAGSTQTYTGLTTVANGTLTLNTSLTSPVNIASGGTLSIPSGSAGLRGEYYNVTPVTNSFNTLSDLNAHLAAYTPALISSSINAGPDFNFNANGSGFPAPYNSGAANFEVRWSGQFNVPVSGLYTFFTASDDGSMLFVDGTTVVNNNYFQGVVKRSGTITLAAGPHDIVIAFYQGGGGYGMYANVIIPGDVEKLIPNSMLTVGNSSIGSLSGQAGSSLSVGGVQFTIQQAADQTFAGVINGSGGTLIKSGPANLTFSGNNTATGTTVISAGTLTINGSMGAGNTIITTNGTSLAGTGAINGVACVSAGATLAPAGSNTAGTLIIGNLNMTDGSAINWDIKAGGSDRITVTNQVTLSTGGVFTIRLYNSDTLPQPVSKTYTVMTWSATAPDPDARAIWTIEKPTGSGTEGWSSPLVTMDTANHRLLLTFHSAGFPSVDNAAGASNITTNSAVLNGNYTATGTTAEVYIYWGTTDGGTTKANWDNFSFIGTTNAAGPFSTAISGLYNGIRYEYRCYASNSIGEFWTSVSSNFVVAPPQRMVNGLRASIVKGLPALNHDPLVLAGSSYRISYNRVFIGGNSSNILGMVEDPQWNVIATGSISNYVTFPGLPATGWPQGENFAAVFSGQLVPRATGFHTFRSDCDDQGMIYIDLNHDGVFQPGEAPWVTPDWHGNGSMYLNSNEVYNCIIMAQNYSGPGTLNFYVTEPAQLEAPVNTTIQAGMWRYYAGPPVLSNGTVSAISTTSAVFGTTLSADKETFSVRAYWGPVNGGTNPLSWANTALIGSWTNISSVDVSCMITGLSPETVYYCTFMAMNAVETVWPEKVQSFRTDFLPSSFPYKMKIIFNGYNKDETLVNFPALVKLGENLAGFEYRLIQPGGSDLRFMDSMQTTSLKYEVEQWDTNGSSYVWVQVPEFTNSCDIWAMWGSGNTNAPEYISNAAWDSSFRGVWHMKESNVVDSTSFKDNGTSLGNVNAVGKIGGAQRFQDNSVQINNVGNFGISDTIAVSAWILAEGGWLNSWQAFVAKNGESAGWALRRYNTSNGGSLTLRGTAANDDDPAGTCNIGDGQWHHMYGVYSGSSKSLYVDGRIEYNVADSGLITMDLRNVRIGSEVDGNTFRHRGLIDEVRIESCQRSSNWIWACYMNQSSVDSFNTYLPTFGIKNLTVTNLAAFSAAPVATLYGIGQVTTVTLYYGQTDGGTNPASWSSSRSLGSFTTLSSTNILAYIAGLLGDTDYCFRFRASCGSATNWTAAGYFKTLVSDLPLYRKMKITFQGYDKPETLDYFPALVIFNEGISNFQYNVFSPGAADLRFINDSKTAELNYEIEEWNTNGNSYIWVQVPQFTNNCSVYAYWGNPAAVTPLAYTTNGATWSHGFGSVWHLREGSNTAYDAVARYVGTPTNVSSITGMIDGATDFSGASALISTTYGQPSVNSYTASAWIRTVDPAANVMILNDRGLGSGMSLSFGLRAGGGKPFFGLDSTGVLIGQDADNPVNDNIWHHLAGVWSSSFGTPVASGQFKIYVDGFEVTATPTSTGTAYAPLAGIGASRIAYHQTWATYLTANLDEIRAETTARTANWIWACWMNQGTNHSSFVNYDQVIKLPPRGTIIFLR